MQLPFTVTSLSIPITTRTPVSRLNDDILLSIVTVDTIVALGVSPAWRTPTPGLCQNLNGVLSGGFAVVAFGVRITRWAFVTGFFNVGVSARGRAKCN